MLIVSTGFKIALLGPVSFAQIFNGGEIRLFAGARPANADTAQGPNLCGVIRRTGVVDTSLQFQQQGAFIIKPTFDIWEFASTLPCTVAWWRLVAAGDDGNDTLTEPRIDGDIGLASAPNDMTFQFTTFDAYQAVNIDSFLYTIPPITT